MHLIVGEVSAEYRGRGETDLARYKRLVIYKNDKTVSIHSDQGYKPLNYMASPAKLEETFKDDERIWTFTTKTESLTVTFHEVYDEINLHLGDHDPGHSIKRGNEKQLQYWLFKKLDQLDSTLVPLSLEYQTGDGPVDILARRGATLVPIEVKRVAPMNTVGQILRYRDALQEKNPHDPVECAIAAVEYKAKTLELAAKKGVQCIRIPGTWKEENASLEVLVSKTLLDLT